MTPDPEARGLRIDHDFVPGAALVALASYAQAGGDRAFLDRLDWQHEQSGAFLTEVDPPGPSVFTAFLAEGAELLIPPCP